MIGSIYWMAKDGSAEWDDKYLLDPQIAQQFKDGGAFIVKAGTLANSVVVFSCCAIVCITILCARRMFLGGELGGPRIWKIVTAVALVTLWIIYVSLSSWYALKNRTCS